MKIEYYLILLFPLLIYSADESFKAISLAPISFEWAHISCDLRREIKKYEKNRENLKYCSCIDLNTRISFATEIIRELMIRHPRSQELNYVSFASGYLLQDYIIILGLIKSGYHNIRISFIDLMYENNKTLKTIEEFKSQLHKDLQKNNILSANIPVNTYISVNQYFQNNNNKPDLIVFADPDMNAFMSYDSTITQGGIIDFSHLKSKVIIRNDEDPVWYISEKANIKGVIALQNLCTISKTNNAMQSLIEYAHTNSIFNIATNHQFISFDEFARSTNFNTSNPLIALLHNNFATALIEKKASAYLMTRQDYLQHDYTLQALSFSGFKRLPCNID